MAEVALVEDLAGLVSCAFAATGVSDRHTTHPRLFSPVALISNNGLGLGPST